jgi:RNA polymerase sigma factor (sigma-70 family)
MMMSMDTIESLITMAQGGDLDAFEAIVRRFRGMAYASASSMLDDAHLAEDVVQETFIEAYLNLPKLREPAAFAGWLRRIVFKQANRLLRGKHLCTLPLEPATDFDLPTEDLDPALLIEDSEKQGAIRQAIAALPEQERLVTLLFYGSGYAIKEIAAFMDVPPGTIKKRLYDARKRMPGEEMAPLRCTRPCCRITARWSGCCLSAAPASTPLATVRSRRCTMRQ